MPLGVEAAPPVLVLFDGQNVLADRGSHAGGWHAHSAIEALPGTIRRPVLVAIDHGGVERTRELWQDLDSLLRFVTAHVLPEVEDRLRLRFDPRARVIGGSSLGGLASLAALARHPEVFSGAMAMSPSAWFAPEIVPELHRARLPGAARVYVDVGHRESDAMVRGAAHVPKVLATRLDPSRLMWRPDRRGKHREGDWRRRLPKALRFLFRR